jgi:hypothetical protein
MSPVKENPGNTKNLPQNRRVAFWKVILLPCKSVTINLKTRFPKLDCFLELSVNAKYNQLITIKITPNTIIIGFAIVGGGVFKKIKKRAMNKGVVT